MSFTAQIREAHRRLAWNMLEQRRAQKLTVEASAFEAEMAPRHWSALEAGQANPTLSTLVRVAVVLKVAISDLFAPVGR